MNVRSQLSSTRRPKWVHITIGSILIVVTVALTVFCIVGKSILLAATYNEKMKQLEAERGERARRTVA